MPTCSKCGKAFTPGAEGWMARLEGPPGGVTPDATLKTILICPEDFAKLGPVQKATWHEYINPPRRGPTREKRPGRLSA
jgi:hypothetical protein